MSRFTAKVVTFTVEIEGETAGSGFGPMENSLDKITISLRDVTSEQRRYKLREQRNKDSMLLLNLYLSLSLSCYLS